ncbi:MAG: type II toxin-antitoxin system YhaV family toxin [Wenzhouxiangella sp.]|nr:MAG: type II toxin-antitoxin system YhaV family toxin [Wenzhouxiangella sp.]
MTSGRSAPLVVNGWTLFAHPLFLDQLDRLISKVESLRDRDPGTYRQKNQTKRLAAIRKLIFEVIPQDPSRAAYRQGKTLGEDHKHWFRAKFFQQYRLFFRYHAASRIIVYVWVNDAKTLRAYASKSDVYRVFRHMLESGNPPDDWEDLLADAQMTTEKFRSSAD